MKCSAALVQFLQAAATDDCVIISTTLENETAEVGSSAAYAGDHSETDAWTALVEEANRAQQSQLHPAGTRSGIDIPKLQPQLWLLRNTATGGKWCFVCYVPEGVHPRGKMHAATARDAIRNAVGLEHFVAGEFHATELSELTLGAFHDWRHTDKRSSMSQREREQADVEESVKAAQAAMPSRVATMQAVPIRTDAVLEGLLQAMKSTALPFAAASSSAGSGTSPSGAAASAAGEGGMSAGALGSPGGAAGAAAGGVSATAVNWIQIQVIPTSPGGSETIVSGGHGHQSEHAALMPHLTTTSSAADGDERASEPRFYLVRPTPPGNGSVLMIYHCPELSKPKQRMLYSTAKAAVMEAAVKAGLPVARTVETRDADDINTALIDFTAAPTGTTAHAVTSPGAAAAPMSSPGSAAKRFGGVGLPGMGMGMPLPGMSPPGAGASGLRKVAQAAPSSEGASDAEGGAKPKPARMSMGVKLPGL